MAQSNFWKTWRVFWLYVREFIGWAFILLSLNIFRICFIYLNRAYVIEGTVAAVVGVMLFRGGLQIVKVAVAARAFRPSVPSPIAASADRDSASTRLATETR